MTEFLNVSHFSCMQIIEYFCILTALATVGGEISHYQSSASMRDYRGSKYHELQNQESVKLSVTEGK